MGYQFTIFRRFFITPKDMSLPDNRTGWRSNQVYLAHFTVSDIANEKFHAAERFSRDAIGLAGASAVRYLV